MPHFILTEGRIGGHEIQRVIELGRAMIAAPVELLDGVEETVTGLALDHANRARFVWNRSQVRKKHVMRRRQARTLILNFGFGSILMAACGETPTDTARFQPGLVVATVTGHFEAEFRGEGSFLAPPRTPGFQMWSRSLTKTKSCPPNGCSQLGLYRVEGEIPGEGAHALVAPEKQYSGTPTALAATFHQLAPGGITESYASLDGEVVITNSQADYVEGDFWFVASQYCRAAPVEMPGVVCHSPLQLDPQAPQITVTGSFEIFRAPDVPAIPQ